MRPMSAWRYIAQGKLSPGLVILQFILEEAVIGRKKQGTINTRAGTAGIN